MLTAASLLTSMGLGAVLAVLVLVLFGVGPRTDAFFAAYGVFAFLSAAAQNLRVTLAAALLPDEDSWRTLDRHVAGVALLVALAALPLVLLGGPLAHLLVGGLGGSAVRTARIALAVLWLAGGLQLLTGLASAAMGARGRFRPPAAGYALGAVSSVLLVVLLAPGLGIQAVAAGVAGGSLVALLVVLHPLVRSGWRPRWRSAGAVATAREVLGGIIGPLVVQLSYVVSVAAAARVGVGAVTVYSYAYFGAVLVIGVTGGSAGIVLAGPLARTWDRSAAALLTPLRDVTRLALLLAAPLLAAGVLVGDDVLRLVVGGTLSAPDIRAVVRVLAVLTLLVAAALAGTVPLLAALAAGRQHAVAGCGLVAVAVHSGVSALAVGTGEVEVVALVAGASHALFVAGLLALVLGEVVGPALLLARDVAVAVALGAAVLALAWAPARTLDLPVLQVPGLLVAALLMLVAVRFLLPSWWDLVARLLRRPARGGSQGGSVDR